MSQHCPHHGPEEIRESPRKGWRAFPVAALRFRRGTVLGALCIDPLVSERIYLCRTVRVTVRLLPERS